MAVVTYPDGIAIWKLIYYTFCLGASIKISWRHGFGKNSGWIYLAIFSVIRIVNASAQIATIKSTSSTTETIATITTFLGLSPLLLASLGLLSRVFYSMLQMPWNAIFSFFVLKLVQTPAAVALILCIVGATSADSAASIGSESTVRAGVILYMIVFAAIVALTLGAVLGRRITHRGEGELIAAVAATVPFLLIRLLYSMLSIFSGGQFNPVTGSTTVELFMATIEEMIVVLIYIWVGLKIQSVPQELESESEGKKLMHRFGRGDFGFGKLGLLSLGAAVINSVGADKKQQPERRDEEHFY